MTRVNKFLRKAVIGYENVLYLSLSGIPRSMTDKDMVREINERKSLLKLARVLDKLGIGRGEATQWASPGPTITKAKP